MPNEIQWSSVRMTRQSKEKLEELARRAGLSESATMRALVNVAAGITSDNVEQEEVRAYRVQRDNDP